MKELNCKLQVKENKGYKNLILVTENGTKVQIKLAFENEKLHYKLIKEVENAHE